MKWNKYLLNEKFYLRCLIKPWLLLKKAQLLFAITGVKGSSHLNRIHYSNDVKSCICLLYKHFALNLNIFFTVSCRKLFNLSPCSLRVVVNPKRSEVTSRNVYSCRTTTHIHAALTRDWLYFFNFTILARWTTGRDTFLPNFDDYSWQLKYAVSPHLQWYLGNWLMNLLVRTR